MSQAVGESAHFMGYPSPVPFVGHGVGLELDELPVLGRRSRYVLEEGMVLALEPKFIIPGKGLAGIGEHFCGRKRRHGKADKLWGRASCD